LISSASLRRTRFQRTDCRRKRAHDRSAATAGLADDRRSGGSTAHHHRMARSDRSRGGATAGAQPRQRTVAEVTRDD